jgi:hypothetical protein
MPAMLPMTIAKITINDLQEIGKMFGTSAHIVNIEATKYINSTMGIDLTPLLTASSSMDNISNEEKMLEVTEIGAMLGYGKGHGAWMNLMIRDMGYQEKPNGRDWMPTSKGEPFCFKHAWTKGKKSGYNLKWNVAKIIELNENWHAMHS